MVASIGIIAYTLFGMRLFSRVDSWQDEKIAQDDGEPVFIEGGKKKRPRAKK